MNTRAVKFSLLVSLLLLCACQSMPPAYPLVGQSASQAANKAARQSASTEQAANPSMGQPTGQGSQQSIEQPELKSAGQSTNSGADQSVRPNSSRSTGRAQRQGASQSAAGQSVTDHSAADQTTGPSSGAVNQSNSGPNTGASQSAQPTSKPGRGANQSARQSANTTGGGTVGDDPPSWSQQQTWLQSQLHYLVKGRVSVRFDEQAQQGDFRLNVKNDLYALRLSGPFGLGAVTLEGDDQRVILSTARHDAVEVTDIDGQLRELLGYPIPIKAIKYWALGAPQPDIAAKAALDPDHPRLTSLEQSGWRIDYKEYKSFNNRVLPRKIDLYGDGVKIRLVFRSWQFDP